MPPRHLFSIRFRCHVAINGVSGALSLWGLRYRLCEVLDIGDVGRIWDVRFFFGSRVEPRGGGGTLGKPKDSVWGKIGVHLREY